MTVDQLRSPAATSALSALGRAAPTGLAVVPVGMLFGILAAQANWGTLEVLIFSALGFSGSGQFALLPLAEQGLGFLTMLLVAISINSRYVPVAFSATARLPPEPVQRAFMAHLVGDEAYALENERDTVTAVLTTRLTIYGAWVTSTVAGALAASFVPRAWVDGMNLGFPASVVLLVLSFRQLKLRIPKIAAPWRRCLLELAICIVVALLLLTVLGKTWFWLPSMAFSTWRLRKAGA